MASSSSSATVLILQIFFFLTLTHKSSAFVLQVTKDSPSLQYIATIHKDNKDPKDPINLVVHLGGSSLWLDCASGNALSPFLPSGSIQCLAAKGSAIFTDSGQPVCGLGLQNPITGASAVGKLAEGLFDISSNSLRASFACAPKVLLQRLASGANGVLGLGRSGISLPSQINPHRKFSLCLSSSNGFLAIDEADRYSKSLMYTPLITREDDYFIKMKSIHVNGKRVSLKGVKEAKLSTVVPYTTLQTSIYNMFTEAFMGFVESLNMTKVGSVAPFEFCFLGSVKNVPTVDFVLQSDMVKWRIEGENLMVKMSDEVMCLGILDGGVSPDNEIVFGGHQLEDRILEFDLGTSMLGFGPKRQQFGCNSDLRLRPQQQPLCLSRQPL